MLVWLHSASHTVSSPSMMQSVRIAAKASTTGIGPPRRNPELRSPFNRRLWVVAGFPICYSKPTVRGPIPIGRVGIVIWVWLRSTDVSE